jgi:signal transduction histidine kinase
MKHAGASEVLVQLMHLTITIEDNGVGFDSSSPKHKGNGLGNVRSRVDYLKGQLDIQSTPGKGTSIHIDFIINQT